MKALIGFFASLILLCSASLSFAGECHPAEGLYVGKMRMIQSHHAFDCKIEVRQVYGMEKDAEGHLIPTLMARLEFPELEKMVNIPGPMDTAKYSEVILPMGGYIAAFVYHASYDFASQNLALPYSVPAYHTDYFGELLGRVDHGRFTGIWLTKAQGNIATFDLTAQKP